MKNVHIVLDLGFGDAGKGREVSRLCDLYSNNKCLVIRFSGGHQAGHTVVYKGIRHIFSSFGAGTLQGVPTFWSRFCTVYPISLVNEYDVLKKLGIDPILKIDPFSPVTTPYDVILNEKIEHLREGNDERHGTCGVGIGTTIQRHNVDMYKLYFMDLFNDKILKAKMNNIESYFYEKYNKIIDEYSESFYSVELPQRLESFYNYIDIIKKEQIGMSEIDIHDVSNFIFEGSQGILLDEDFGFFPNVTRGKTTADNAMTLIKEFHFCDILYEMPSINLNYVTRSYQNRHGNGFMSNENDIIIPENPLETNIENKWQGKFRTGSLDIELLAYSIFCNEYYLTVNATKNTKLYRTLMVTCTDQIPMPDIKPLLEKYTFYKVFKSFGPNTEDYKSI